MKNQVVVTRTRDKNLLILLGIIVVIFVIYYFLMSPALDKSSQLKLEQELVYAELVTMQTTVEQLPANRKKASEDLVAITEKYKQFFYEIRQERILYKLDTLIDNTNIPVNAYTQTKPVAKAIEAPDVVYVPLTYLLLEQAAVVNEKLAKTMNLGNAEGAESKAKKDPAKDQLAVSY